jgi:hypothetical protein
MCVWGFLLSNFFFLLASRFSHSALAFKQDDTFRQVLKNKKVKKRFIIYFE